ncbi:hypothetical protein CLU85_4173 [Acidovorax sp. 69]|uniref:hypothetical protein n=1 Tax=Acidovorax sp. 69 TaxID=2035202 RepID=UPI000C242D80|nr:hypothetical protein [Acidovorax sp. 69]PJI99329.1 hypothetical protein CLU85_4173 [Acidovorax sp. 69]
MKDLIRTIFSIRQDRRPAPVGHLPPVGTVILRGELKMVVTHLVPGELWDWLVLSGWRNMPVKTDRRKGMRLPDEALKTLIDAEPHERNQVHARLLEQALPQEQAVGTPRPSGKK